MGPGAAVKPGFKAQYTVEVRGDVSTTAFDELGPSGPVFDVAILEIGAGEEIRTLDPNLGKRWEAPLPISPRSDEDVF